MPQPSAAIQDSFTNQQVTRGWQNRNQYITYRMIATTTDATATELFIDGVSGFRLKFPTASCAGVQVLYAYYNSTDGTGGTLQYMNNCNVTAANVYSSGTQVADAALAGTAGSVLALAADDTLKAFKLTATGTAAKTIYHEAIVTVALATLPENTTPTT